MQEERRTALGTIHQAILKTAPGCLSPTVFNDPDEDCDGDGFSDYQEYLAETDPTASNSFLRLELIDLGTAAELMFTGVEGRQYGLERRVGLNSEIWIRVATTIPDDAGQVTLTDTMPPAGRAFYRVLAEFP